MGMESGTRIKGTNQFRNRAVFLQTVSILALLAKRVRGVLLSSHAHLEGDIRYKGASASSTCSLTQIYRSHTGI
jgi:hypothetical protein